MINKERKESVSNKHAPVANTISKKNKSRKNSNLLVTKFKNKNTTMPKKVSKRYRFSICNNLAERVSWWLKQIGPIRSESNSPISSDT